MASKARDVRQSVRNQLKDYPGRDKREAYVIATHVTRSHRRGRPN